MNISTKKFIAAYGLRFSLFYVLAFFLLVTFTSKFNIDTFFGDVLVKRPNFVIYLPFGSAFGVAAFLLVVFEIYKQLK
jgi:hypothetical protein